MLEEAVDPVEIQICKRLWAAVFHLGVQDAVADRNKGRYWLYKDDHYPGSFSWLCELFNHNHEYIRQLVVAKFKDKPHE